MSLKNNINVNGVCDVTVAVLTRNGGQVLRRLVTAVCNQQTDRHFELLAVDSGSADGTRALLAEKGAAVVTIPSEDFNFGAARDVAFEHARGAIVVSLSQDAVPAHDRWLDNLVAPLEDAAVAASCGRSIPDPGRETPQFPWERNGYFYFTREMGKFSERYGKGLSNANSAIRRAVWERLRFGNQAIGEDFSFQTKLAAANLRVAFPDDAPVLHHHDYTLRSLVKR
ncbi:MAG TPA: glycosyltransferase family 2 protein, partial [Candidatus Hydrogenedentes bacterium]|nr:glycosyltransferase family 2 protein [Candidatus Hydrogenedentota bacterium]